MKNLMTAFLCLFIVSGVFSQSEKKVKARLFFTKFYAPDTGPFIETSLSVAGESVVYVKNANNKYQGAIEISMIFSKDSSIVNFDKYELLSPEIDDTVSLSYSFLDQQRYILPNGLYNFEIKIKDVNNPVESFSSKQTIEIDFSANNVSLSGIQLVESYKKTTVPSILSKSGFDIIPYVNNFYPDNVNSLRFYVEVYNAEKVLGAGEKFLINYFIENFESSKKLNKFVRFKKEDTKPVNVLFTEFDISELPSGNYHLVVEVRNKENELVESNKFFFQRSNPDAKPDFDEFSNLLIANSFVSQITNQDTLKEYIHSLAPISTDMERNFVTFQIDKGMVDFEMMQRFFLNFWLDRNQNNPEYAWKKYLSDVQLVDELYGYPGKNKGTKGYNTDRGVIYLKYGPPNTIVDKPFELGASGMTINDGGVESSFDGGGVPYQVWHYYTLKDFRNIKFVFVNQNIALTDYQLVHSNFPGEISNENWQAELVRGRGKVQLPENDKYTGKSGNDYNNPR